MEAPSALTCGRARPQLAAGEAFIRWLVAGGWSPKALRNPQQKEQGTAAPGQGCWLGYPRGFPAAPECWEGKAPGAKIYFLTAFQMHKVCVWWLPLCRKEGWILPQRVNEVKRRGGCEKRHGMCLKGSSGDWLCLLNIRER